MVKLRNLWPDLDSAFVYKQQKRPWSKTQYKRSKVAAMDTETQNGDVQTLHSASLSDDGDRGYTTHYRDEGIPFSLASWVAHAVRHHAWVNRTSPKGGKTRLYLTTPDFFAWNLGFDSGVMMKTLPPETLAAFALNSVQVIDLTTGEIAQGVVRDRRVWIMEDGSRLPKNKFAEVLYIGKKILRIEPINTWIKGAKVSKVCIYDVSQLFQERRLQDAAMTYLGEGKDPLDTEMMGKGGSDSDAYWEAMHDEIIHYGERDAILTARLAWIRLDEYQKAGVVVHRPLSKASIARNNLFRMCEQSAEEFADPMLEYPILDEYMGDSMKRPIVEAFLSAYAGGWFEMSGAGTWPGGEVLGFDLVSAYPHVMYFLPNVNQLTWVTDRSAGVQGIEDYLLRHRPYWPSIIYAKFEFPRDLPFYPLSVMNEDYGTVQNPRVLTRWATADEVKEARQWGAKVNIFHGAYAVVHPQTSITIPPEEEDRVGVQSGVHYPFRQFLSTFYGIKAGVDLIPKEDRTPSDNSRRAVSKVMLNSGYGLTLCTVGEGEEDVEGNISTWERTAAMWNPIYAATITAGCRMRIAEFMRMNNHEVISVATDGVVIPKAGQREIVVPPNPSPIPGWNLGDWEQEAEGDFFAIGSGVYSIIGPSGKTTMRGHASRFLQRGDDGRWESWRDWCDRMRDKESTSKTFQAPYSMGEARVRSNYDLVGQFRECQATMRPTMDAMKRPMWPEGTATTFGDLDGWYASKPPQRVTRKPGRGIE